MEVPILIRWEKLQKLLSSSDDKVKRYKDELFGSSTVEQYPDEYNTISIIKKAGQWIDYDLFKTLPLHTRSKLIAHTYLENIVEVLQRHDSLQKQKAKDLENRAKK